MKLTTILTPAALLLALTLSSAPASAGPRVQDTRNGFVDRTLRVESRGAPSWRDGNRSYGGTGNWASPAPATHQYSFRSPAYSGVRGGSGSHVGQRDFRSARPFYDRRWR
jgi:hypothetical protein